MMQKNSEDQRLYENKIGLYLDGVLSSQERSEFEAFVSVNPEFKKKIDVKQTELEQIRNKIPTIVLSARSRETLETELKQSVFNLLQRERRSMWQKVQDFFEEKFSR